MPVDPKFLWDKFRPHSELRLLHTCASFFDAQPSSDMWTATRKHFATRRSINKSPQEGQSAIKSPIAISTQSFCTRSTFHKFSKASRFYASGRISQRFRQCVDSLLGGKKDQPFEKLGGSTVTSFYKAYRTFASFIERREKFPPSIPSFFRCLETSKATQQQKSFLDLPCIEKWRKLSVQEHENFDAQSKDQFEAHQDERGGQGQCRN